MNGLDESHPSDAPRHNLNDLIAKSRSIKEVKELISIARDHLPSGAKVEAMRRGYSEKTAKRCRFAAMIRRDYGLEEFERIFNGNGSSKPIEVAS